MKAIINRRLYDTETSELLDKATIHDFFDNERPAQEALYKSPNLGHLFICKVEESYLGTTSTIRLVTEDDALEWLLRHQLVTEELTRKIGVEVEEA